ncbi:MAG: hypothetical protein JO092_00045 [Candidatus Eremiobacteraeota bacterium]|nr:hypothetical protein [Candidatus Eremiobacteraeota bacterium]
MGTALLIANASAAPARDGAVIVDSGSTNTAGYKIELWSDGSGTVTLQNRFGETHGAAKTFAVSSALAQRFFADLKAARDGNAVSEPCMKSASFGTTTHAQWHGWNSPDLDCPAGNGLTAALVSDVNAIRSASGIGTMPLHRPLQAPPHVEASP